MGVKQRTRVAQGVWRHVHEWHTLPEVFCDRGVAPWTRVAQWVWRHGHGWRNGCGAKDTSGASVWRHGHEWRNGCGATATSGAMSVAPRTRVAHWCCARCESSSMCVMLDVCCASGVSCPRCVVLEVCRARGVLCSRSVVLEECHARAELGSTARGPNLGRARVHWARCQPWPSSVPGACSQPWPSSGSTGRGANVGRALGGHEVATRQPFFEWQEPQAQMESNLTVERAGENFRS